MFVCRERARERERERARIWRKDKVLSNCAQHSGLAMHTDANASALLSDEVLQLSSGIALLGTAELAGGLCSMISEVRQECNAMQCSCVGCAKIADFWLMNCVPERKLGPRTLDFRLFRLLFRRERRFHSKSVTPGTTPSRRSNRWMLLAMPDR